MIEGMSGQKIMQTKIGNHCWHWSYSSYAANRPLEECCNCDKIVEERERWSEDNGQCEWEIWE